MTPQKPIAEMTAKEKLLLAAKMLREGKKIPDISKATGLSVLFLQRNALDLIGY